MELTTQRLFSNVGVLTSQDVTAWIEDVDLSERLDAFVARFGRLQDTIGDKLIPSFLNYLGESVGPAVDNLDKAERFGWIDSADDWYSLRKLRNQMVHEYIEDMVILADALETGRQFVPALKNMSYRLADEVDQRLSR
ncbi:hypothetical protein GCM10008094_30550 [Aidingimonas halophila]|nr:hypothetical protein GCM10008094_30550 [Aidingimonas halophila]